MFDNVVHPSVCMKIPVIICREKVAFAGRTENLQSPIVVAKHVYYVWTSNFQRGDRVSPTRLYLETLHSCNFRLCAIIKTKVGHVYVSNPLFPLDLMISTCVVYREMFSISYFCRRRAQRSRSFLIANIGSQSGKTVAEIFVSRALYGISRGIYNESPRYRDAR